MPKHLELLTTEFPILSRVRDTHSCHEKDSYHPPKSNKNRIVSISDDLKNLLIELRNLGSSHEVLSGLNGKQHDFNDLVLPRSTEWRRGSQASITRRFCEQIGLKPIKFHDLRATFITNLLSQGVSTPKVMSIVGHSRLGTTEKYLRLAGIETKGVTDSLSYSLPKLNQGNLISFSSIE